MTTTLPLPFSNVRGLLYALLFLYIPANSFSQPARSNTGKLVITFTDIRSDLGEVSMGLYNTAEQWTDTPVKSYAWNKDKLKDGRMVVEIDQLPRGTFYALAVLDDENKDGDMNYTLGIPLEGWGMSNNPSFLKLKEPPFDECSFELDAPVIRFEIKMNYVNKNKKVKEQ